MAVCHVVANQELVNWIPWLKNTIIIIIIIIIIYALRDEHKMVCK